MKISVVIPNFNGEKIISQNLPKILTAISMYPGDAEIIITDDSSKDDSIKVINNFINENKQSKVEIKLLKSDKDKNRGFSSNVNAGVAISSGEILILLNTDVAPDKNFLSPLLKHFEDEKVFAVGCMDESVENEKVIDRGRGIGKWEKGFLFHSAGVMDKDNTLWVSGGSGAFRKSIWDILGGLDPIYNPFYWEDIDLSYRALKSGYKLIFEKKSVVRHDHDNGVIKSKYKSEDVNKIVYRNQFIFAWKNADFKNLFINFIYLPYFILTTLLNSNINFTKGLISALVLFPRIIISRHRSSKYFKLKDIEVINNL